jgi:hypothetical protein
MTEESNTEQIINEYVEAAIVELEAIEKELAPLRKKKRDIIKDLAFKISETNTIPYDYISEYLCKHKKLMMYVSENYIRDNLPSETKNKKKVTVKRTEISGLDDKKVIELTTTGQEEGRPSSPYIPEAVFTPRINIPSPANIFDKDNAMTTEIGQGTTDYVKLDFDSTAWRKIWNCKSIGHPYVYIRISGHNNIEVLDPKEYGQRK